MGLLKSFIGNMKDYSETKRIEKLYKDFYKKHPEKKNRKSYDIPPNRWRDFEDGTYDPAEWDN